MSEEEIEESLEIINKWLKKNYPITEEELGDNEFIAKDLEIERLNSIITELEKWLEENGKYIDDSDYAAIYVEDIMNKLKELKGSDKE